VTVAEIASFNNINASRPLKIGQSLELPPGAKFIPSAERRKVVKKSSLPVAAAAVRSTPRKSKPMPSGNTHSVVSGDSLSKIAQTYGVTVKQLCELNGLSRQSILQLKQVVKLGQVAKPAKSKSVVASTSKQKNKPAAAAVVTTQANKPVDTVTSLPEPANIDLPTAVAETAIEIDQPETAPGMDISKLKTLPHVVGENDTLEIISGMYNSTPEWIKEANKGLTNNADLTGTFKGKEITVPCRGISP
jgi:LysM repeat protein